MTSTLIRGKYVVTKVLNDQTSEIIEDGAIAQRDGKIVDVGKYEEIKARHTADEVIGSTKYVVIPGLVNAHHHTGLTPFQLGTLDLPMEPWLVAQWGGPHRDMYLDTLYCALQMLQSGITTVMHNHAVWGVPPDSALEEGGEVLRAYQDSGMRVAFSFAYRDQHRLVYQDDETFLATLPAELAAKAAARLQSTVMSNNDYFSLFAEMYSRYGSNRADQRIMHLLSPINLPRCSDDFLRSVKEHALRYRTGIHIHLQETIYQRMYSESRFGKTPLAHLQDLEFLGPEVSCAHGVWLTNTDIDILEETGTCICHNASSNLRLKSGVAPVNALTAKGVTVAIGIDEAGLNDDNDILQEMRLVQKLHRVPGMGTPSPTSHQVLQMATANGAQATLFADRIGTLEIGKQADIVLINLNHITEPYLDPDTNIVDAILYRGRGLDVDTVMVGGEVLMRDRRFTKVDQDAIVAELKAQLASKPRDLDRRQLARDLYPYIQEFFQQWALRKGLPHYAYNET